VASYDVVFKRFSAVTLAHALTAMPLWSSYGDAYHRGDHGWIHVALRGQLAKAAGKALFDYDRFWASAGGMPASDGFYRIPAALPDAPQPSATPSREGRRRQIKRGIAEAAAASLRHGFSRSSSCSVS
jgi:hypothetical protein